MDRKIKAPTKAEFLNLFGDLRSQALISGNWMKYGDMWFDLYRRSWLTRIFHRSRATNEYGIALVCPKIQVSNLDQRAGNAEAKLYRRN